MNGGIITAAVAVGTPRQWRGVAVPHDGQPTVTGKQSWDIVQARLKMGESLDQFAVDLMRFSDWDAFLRGGLCPHCGCFAAENQLTSPLHEIPNILIIRNIGIKGRVPSEIYQTAAQWNETAGTNWDPWKVVDAEIATQLNLARCQYPDPLCLWHQHAGPPPVHLTEASDPQPDWVYVYCTEPFVKLEPALVVLHEGEEIACRYLYELNPTWGHMEEVAGAEQKEGTD